MKTDTKNIQKLESVFGTSYAVFVRRNKHRSWIYLGEVPTLKIAHGLVKVGREIYLGEK